MSDKRAQRALTPIAKEGKPELPEASASMPTTVGVAAHDGRQINATSDQKKQLRGIKCTISDCPANPGSKKEELPPPPELREAELYRLLRGAGDQENEHASFLHDVATSILPQDTCSTSVRRRVGRLPLYPPAEKKGEQNWCLAHICTQCQIRSGEQMYSQQLPDGHASTRLRLGRTSPSGVEVVVTDPLAGDREAGGGPSAATEEDAALEQAAREHAALEAAAEAALGKPIRDMYGHQASALVAAADARSQAAEAERERADNKKKSRTHKVKKVSRLKHACLALVSRQRVNRGTAIHSAIQGAAHMISRTFWRCGLMQPASSAAGTWYRSSSSKCLRQESWQEGFVAVCKTLTHV
eukprot:6191925-Pleurochrysis_carterae.AAC.1